ncbi:MAG TPA: arginine decarboxylase, partial [Bacilli bacterium]|nr:arginine decarboxylase [Bacilli bacterium]
IISVKELGITGYQAELWLREHYNLEVELSDLYNILCIISFGDSEVETNTLINALQELSNTYCDTPCAKQEHHIYIPDIPVLAMSPRDAFYSETELVPFHESVGRIIAEFIMVYPPGIPILIPGEIITDDNLHYIEENLRVGLPVQGPEDETFQYLRVIKEFEAIR